MNHLQIDINGDCSRVETILKKKAADLTEDDKAYLDAFQKDYKPREEQLKDTVTKVAEIVGRESAVPIEEFAAARSQLKRTLQRTTAIIKEVVPSPQCNE